MWFLWFIITFFVAIASGSQIMKAVVNSQRPNKIATIVVSAVIAVAWLIISLAVEAIRNHWSALLVGWILGLVGSAISIKLNKDNYSAPTSTKGWNDMSFDEKRQEARDAVNRAKQDMEAEGIDVDGEFEKFCDDFNRQNKLGKYKDVEVTTTQKEAVVLDVLSSCDEDENAKENFDEDTLDDDLDYLEQEYD